MWETIQISLLLQEEILEGQKLNSFLVSSHQKFHFLTSRTKRKRKIAAISRVSEEKFITFFFCFLFSLLSKLETRPMSIISVDMRQNSYVCTLDLL